MNLIVSFVYWEPTLAVYKLAPGEPDEGRESQSDLKKRFEMYYPVPSSWTACGGLNSDPKHCKGSLPSQTSRYAEVKYEKKEKNQEFEQNKKI